jgi:CBS domain-containing protein
MKIGNLASHRVVGADRRDSLREACSQLASNEVGALIVYDSHGPIGVFSERDLVQAVADGADLDLTPIRDYATLAPVRVESASSLAEAIAKMSELGVRHLAVVDEDEIVGVVSARDVLRALHQRNFKDQALESASR